MAVQFGLAVGAGITRRSVFARKNYFYPDLPKGYQISQYELPIVAKGHLDVMLEDGSVKRVGITRAHLEEDAGKSMHEGHAGVSAIDLNRAGTPLIEIVSEPDMRSAKEAVAYMKKVHTLVRYLGICDGNMQEGSFRCDANVSVRRKGAEKLGTRAELEEPQLLPLRREGDQPRSGAPDRDPRRRRQGGAGNAPLRLPTRTRPARCARRKRRTTTATSPIRTCCRWCSTSRSSKRCARSCRSCRTRRPRVSSRSTACRPMTRRCSRPAREMADFLRGRGGSRASDAKLAANWVMGDFSAFLNKDGLEICASRLSAAQLGGLLQRIVDNTISGKLAKEVFEVMWADAADADTVIEARGLKQITDSGAIEKVIDEIMAANPKQLADYRSGKDKLFGFFVGQAMKATGGKANPALLNDLLKKKLAP